MFTNGGYDGKFLFKGKVQIAPLSPIQLYVGEGVVYVPGLEFDLGLLINQSRLTIDRSSNYFFSLSVEDCVNKTSMYATRRSDDSETKLKQLEIKEPAHQDEVFKNGSLLSVWVEGFEEFEKFAVMQYGEFIES